MHGLGNVLKLKKQQLLNSHTGLYHVSSSIMRSVPLIPWLHITVYLQMYRYEGGINLLI